MKKLWNWIRRDGLLHIETCALIVIVFGLFLPWWAAFGISMLVGAGKEWWDEKHGVSNWHDAICDFVGAVIGTIIILI